MTHSEQETLAHIRRVQSLLGEVSRRLFERAIRHDQSKLSEPEASVFESATAKLKDVVYGSDEYKACLAEMKPALDHHYANNSHHPEHHPCGVRGMTLLDLIEMLVDWKAAGERHKDGTIDKSLLHNKSRFGYSDDVDMILRRTAIELFDGDVYESWHCFGCGAGGWTGNFCEQCTAGRNDYKARI